MKYAIRFESSSALPNSAEKAIYETLVAALGRIENFELTAGATFIGLMQRHDQPILWIEADAEARLP